VKLNDEGQEFRWVTLEQALTLPINQPTRTLLITAAEKRVPRQKQTRSKKSKAGKGQHVEDHHR
jgi:hypothetical protein